jgi:hypothetical protein
VEGRSGAGRVPGWVEGRSGAGRVPGWVEGRSGAGRELGRVAGFEEGRVDGCEEIWVAGFGAGRLVGRSIFEPVEGLRLVDAERFDEEGRLAEAIRPPDPDPDPPEPPKERASTVWAKQESPRIADRVVMMIFMM